MINFVQEPIQRFLALAIRGSLSEKEKEEMVDLYNSLGESTCLNASRENKVEYLVASTMVGVLRKTAAKSWHRELTANKRYVKKLLAELGNVVDRINRLGCPHAVIESGGVMLGSELPIAAYCSRDFDILVPPKYWNEIQDCFHSRGYRARDRRQRPTKRIEFARDIDGKTYWLEAGFTPFDRMWVPLIYNDQSEKWLSRTVPSTKFTDISVLNPADALVLVSIHTSLHSYVRSPGIRLYVDIDRLVRDNEIEWGQVVDSARESALPTRAFLSLAIARSLLDTPIPEGVLVSLAPNKYRHNIIRHLINRETPFFTKKNKLTGFSTILFDMLLDDRGIVPWTTSVLLPPSRWLRDHFGRQKEGDSSAAALHLKRWISMASRWRPE